MLPFLGLSSVAKFITVAIDESWDSRDDLKAILSSEQSYKSFRAHLKTCIGACIPYLGMYLTDLTFIEDGNSTFLKPKDKELINFQKCVIGKLNFESSKVI